MIVFWNDILLMSWFVGVFRHEKVLYSILDFAN